MSWQCKECGAENAGRAVCGCGRHRPHRKFSLQWVFISAIFFLIVYLTGTAIGGALIDVAHTPTDKEILTVANEKDPGVRSLSELSREDRAAARAQASERTKSSMSEGTWHIIYWFVTIILVFFCGGISGFVSSGRVIIEAGIGSALGQLMGYGFERLAFERDVGTTAISIIIVIGILFALLGAWVGEVLQGKEEQAV